MAKDKKRNFPITAVDDIDVDAIKKSQIFKDWLNRLDLRRFKIRGLHMQSLDLFRGNVGFVKLKADVTDKGDKRVPGIVFLRGGSVAMLFVLVCKGRRYAVLTVQPRLATGSFAFTEIPAGMTDGSGDFAGVAAKEIEEEIGVKINKSQLIDLTALAGNVDGLYLSPGVSDETIRIFYYHREVTEEELKTYQGRLTGALAEGEQITLKVVPLDDLWKIPDAKTAAAYMLYNKVLALI